MGLEGAAVEAEQGWLGGETGYGVYGRAQLGGLVLTLGF